MAKDKVFSKYAPTLSNDAAYQAYLDDQERRRKEAEEGKVRYVEAAKASRPQYTLPGYQGKSAKQGSKTYAWERELLYDTKVKGAGNSYNKKFDALTSSMGMSEGQAEDFRRYLDFQEDSQHVDPKMNKDGKINQSQSLKYARDTRMKTDVIDGILDNMYKTGKAEIKKDKEVQFKKVTGWDKLQNALGIDLSDEQKNTLEAKKLGVEPHYGGKKDKTAPVSKEQWEELKQSKAKEEAGKETEERDGIYGLLDRFVLPISQGATNVILPGNEEVQIQNDLADNGKVDNPATRAGMVDRGLETDILRGAGTMAGYLAPYGQGYKAVNAALNLPKLAKAAQFVDNSPYLGRAAVGGAAGLTAEAGLAATNELANSEAADMSDYALRMGLGAAGGAIGDPLLHGAGQLMKGGLGQFAKVNGDIPEFSGNVSDNVLDSLVPQQGNYAQPSNELFDRLLNQKSPEANGTTAQAQTIPNDDELASLFGRLLGEDAPPVPKPQPQEQIVNNSQAPEEALASLARPETNPAANKIPSEQEFIDQELAPYRESAEKQTQARQTWETVVKGAQDQAKRIKNYYGKIVPDGNSKDMINEIPPQFRAAKSGKGNDIYSFADQEGFSSADEAIAFLKQIDLDSKMKLKDLTPEDNYVLSSDEWDMLEQVARQKYAETHGGQQPSDKVLDQLIRENEDWGNAPAMSDEGLDNFLNELSGNPSPKAETEAISPAPTSDVPTKEQIDTAYSQLTEEANRLVQERPEGFMDEVQKIGEQIQQIDAAVQSGDEGMLLKLNLQRFAPSAPTSLVETRTPISTDSPIAKQTNPIKRTISKFYEGYVNRNHSAKLTEVQSLETAAKKAKTEGRVKKAEQLNNRLKQVKKHGSDFDKAVGNELASSSAAKNSLDRHFDALQQTLKPGKGEPKVKMTEEMSGALEYQMAMNLDWIRTNVDKDYKLPNGWDWGMINDVINVGNAKTKYKAFVQNFRNMTQELRDTRLDYGLISKESHEALGKNPFYVPLSRDMSQVMDNIDIGNLGIGGGGRGSGDKTLHSLDGGAVETFFKNPLESMMDQTFSVYKAAYRNDTAQQALKMAELDKDGTLGLAKEIHEKSVKPGDLTVYIDGKKKYVRLQDDLVKMLNENESVLDLGKLGKVTQMFAALKTRSFEYQTAAAPRDVAQAYLTSQVSNPVRYFGEMMKAIKNKSANAKEVGAYFDKAYNDHVAGVDPNKILKEFQKQSGNLKTFDIKDPKSWKEVGGVVKKILDTPFKPSKLLGQITDEIPREIEVKEAERLFMKQHGRKMENIQAKLDEVNTQIESANGITDPFDPALQGIDKLKGQKDKLEGMLRQFNQDLKREQVYRGRDVMDYSRMGNSKATKNIIRPWVIFANTTTQSKDKIIRSFIERPGYTFMKATALTAPFVAAEQINFDNMNESDRKTYDALPSWMKQFNYVYIDNGTTYAVPKLHELALITNPIEAALKGESLDDSMRLLMKETLPYQSGTILQGFGPKDDDTTPTQNMQFPSIVASPALDILANRKLGFNQKPVSYGGLYKGADAPANEWTMDMFKKLMGDNPGADKTQYGVQQYGGDLGKYSTYTLDALLEPSNSKKIDEMLRNLNPLQDRYYKEGSRYFKPTPQETKK